MKTIRIHLTHQHVYNRLAWPAHYSISARAVRVSPCWQGMDSTAWTACWPMAITTGHASEPMLARNTHHDRQGNGMDKVKIYCQAAGYAVHSLWGIKRMQ